jgi:hypothetical protein
MILVLARELVEAQNLARACMPPLAYMLPPALILMLRHRRDPGVGLTRA